MKRKSVFISVLLVVIIVFSSTILEAKKKGRWIFTSGLSYISGFSKVVDFYKSGTSFTPTYIPVGGMFVPHYQFENGFAIGFGIGPIMFIYGDVHFFNIPVSLDLKYLFNPKATNSFYIRAGLKYNIAFGDEIKQRNIGPFGGIGYQFSRYAVEVAYDISSITFGEDFGFYSNQEKIKPSALMISLFVLF